MARVETLLDSFTEWREESRVHRAEMYAKISSIESKMTIEPDLHVKHHTALQRFIEREDAAQARREKVKAHVIGWSFVTIISGIGYAFLEFVRGLLKIKGLL